MLSRKLPLGRVACDQCGVAEVTLVATAFDAARREVHREHGWMLQGFGPTLVAVALPEVHAPRRSRSARAARRRREMTRYRSL